MHAIRRLSIRWRITLGSLAIALLVSAVAVVGFRLELESLLDGTTKTLLQHDAAPSVGEIEASTGGRLDQPGRGQLTTVVDPSGAVAVSTMPKTLVGRIPAMLRFGRGEVHSVVGGDDVYRVLNTPVVTARGTWHVLTMRNQDSSMLLLQRATGALVVVAALFVVGFGVASWLLASAALRPVNRMRRQAELLVETGSAEPLPTGPAVDELSALARTLNQFLAQVSQSVERERQLVSDASHELRTPLAVLTTQLELAALAAGDAAALEEQVAAARATADRLSALATGLLELSRLDANGPQGSSGWDELAAELAESVDRGRLLGAAEQITVDYDIDEQGTAARYRISVQNFGRLVGNLVTNAVTVLPSGGVVRVALRHSRAGLVLTVADNGPGMPEDFIPIAFDRFTRSDEARAAQRGGSGLGLAIVQAIVSAARGSIALANANGLVVTVALPAED